MKPPQPQLSYEHASVGVVVIGRNEGERLRRCLSSLDHNRLACVYVDSGSSDGSVELASAMGVGVICLDLTTSFSAARARNEGWKHLLKLNDTVRYVQFVDGDCELVDSWIGRAVSVLSRHADLAAVCGRRRERYPELSIYNRICDLEWDTPVGEAQCCGGDAMYRREALEQSGGFDCTVPAGEEPELGARLRAAGWRILRVGTEMTLHDAGLNRFALWWKRQIRSGYGGADIALRFRLRFFVRQAISTWIWTVALGIAAMAGAAGTALAAGGAWPLAFAAAGAGVPALQVFRVARDARCRGCSWSDAWAYGMLILVGKWGQLIGQMSYLHDLARGQTARLIEYKASALPGSSICGSE